MKVEVKEPKPWQRVLEIDASLDLMKREVNELYREYGRQISLPGFRKGRVPEGLIRAKYGKSIEKQALERAIPKIYEQALEKTAQKPITKAILEDVNYKPEEGVSFKAVFEVIPPVDVKGYRGISLEKRARKVTRRRVKRELNALRELHRELVTVDREARKGDYTVVDYTCTNEDGKPLDGGSGTNYSLFITGEGLSTGLLGSKEGERREVPHTYPEDWADAKLAGRKVIYEFEIKEVKETRLPRLDNGFAQDVGFDSLKRLKQKVRERLAAKDEKAAREELEFQLSEKLIQANSFDPSPSLIESYLMDMVEDVKKKLPPEKTLDEAALRAERRPFAEYKARRGIILDRIAELEHIEVSDEELEKRIKDLAEGSKMSYRALRDFLERRGETEGIRVGLRRDKTLGFLVDNASIRTVRRRGE